MNFTHSGLRTKGSESDAESDDEPSDTDDNSGDFLAYDESTWSPSPAFHF